MLGVVYIINMADGEARRRESAKNSDSSCAAPFLRTRRKSSKYQGDKSTDSSPQKQITRGLPEKRTRRSVAAAVAREDHSTSLHPCSTEQDKPQVSVLLVHCQGRLLPV
ncbi:uncharacterized protein LOC135472880 [Liolophura sinensis]|uniref:uncharacterized protein LOC135472880 n=1 Tax=Liolophura sinensis TaxID=3198878 RepID=UPI003159901B